MDEKMKIITEEYEKELQIYYNKNFVGKNLNLAILDNIKDVANILVLLIYDLNSCSIV